MQSSAPLSPMRAVRVHAYGDDSELRVENVPAPRADSLAPSEVLVKNAFIGLNFIDIYHRRGLYPIPLPATLGREGSGIVSAVGAGVRNIKVGDRVAFYAPNAYAEQTVVPAARVSVLPSSVSLELASAVFLQGLTAQYLTDASYHIRPGDRVVVHAAAGGTGQVLCKVAKLRGAHVIGTCSAAKAAVAQAAGADEVVTYDRHSKEALQARQAAWVERIQQITKGEGVHCVYDSIGADTFDGSLSVLRTRGTLVLYGQSSGRIAANFDPLRLARGSFFLTRPLLDHFVSDGDEMATRSADLWRLVSQGVAPAIHTVLPLADVREAHRILESGSTTGKVLLKP
jgi:NADPH2:quinone reductase